MDWDFGTRKGDLDINNFGTSNSAQDFGGR